MLGYLRVAAATVLVGLLLPSAAYAGTKVLEGEEAKKMYEQTKATANTLRQTNTIFVLKKPDGTETEKAEEMKVKVGEYIFITNEEEKVVHNVYDESDQSWVLKKQEPGNIAAIAFDTAGVHKLRCAIHPKMKIVVTVE